ncbi:MAG: 7-cyano-7-deazaguanine reductase [Candidatus Lambdaproteobacteria bacterium RIFOXYD12_FULL_49_8]|uniref:7-cyano-7-deazaguanine reductase n=1 Tax=Candidatus Lambdaproteobacteria bacterium RIFOXYD2_FULL_50_16 TaxID=1817772 RepID=A0A1F6GFT2_9PROT|nr:MAG: 7-cyano-7-deazaguanine reductase [Candidatus Lambdaproteobacteria bacterium RIFOXYD12_FULL_49_8]OGG96963.1 MAG: 7-cyano-7-deazaguanine reductase [Candidatus Lambdaproteobacteria bacterium RIFOXYD2_FULL_50_16]
MAQAEGLTFEFDGPEAIRTDLLETFAFDSKGQYIHTETSEFSAVCPFSGLPDLGVLTIEYYPEGGRCVELKSLKYYMTSFRNVGLYQEGVTKRIFEDLKVLLGTHNLKVSTLYQPRGGFTTRCVEGRLNPEPH